MTPIEAMECLFIRSLKYGERGNPVRHIPLGIRDGTLTELDGYEIVYKPYGNSGRRTDAGFYHLKRESACDTHLSFAVRPRTVRDCLSD